MHTILLFANLVTLPGLEYCYLLIIKTFQDLTYIEEQEILIKQTNKQTNHHSGDFQTLQIISEHFGHHHFDFELSSKAHGGRDCLNSYWKKMA